MENTQHDQPLIEIQLGDSHITLLGTAHVSRASAEAVEAMLKTGKYDAVAVELCPSRYKAIVHPESMAKMDLLQVFREGKTAMVTANLAMAAYQQRLADQFDIEPGAEQRIAIDVAKQQNLPVLLIDREIGITLKRIAGNLSWWKRAILFSGLVGSMLSREEVDEEEIEKLKEGDILETTFAEFAHDRQDLYLPLIAERDQYMTARLLQELNEKGHENLLVVIGAGHMHGMAKQLQKGFADPAAEITRLDQLPIKKRWPKVIPWLIVVLIMAGFALGFARSPDLGWDLVISWVVINGSLSALGALLARAHPLTIITAFVAAPITSLNPTIGAGMVAGAAELWLRKPTVKDFETLRDDTKNITGWWKNRVSRTLLVFLFSTLGSAAGTYIAGFNIISKLT